MNRPAFVIHASRSRWPILYISQPSYRIYRHACIPLFTLTSPVGAHTLAVPLDAIITGYLVVSAIIYRRYLMQRLTFAITAELKPAAFWGSYQQVDAVGIPAIRVNVPAQLSHSLFFLLILGRSSVSGGSDSSRVDVPA